MNENADKALHKLELPELGGAVHFGKNSIGENTGRNRACFKKI